MVYNGPMWFLIQAGVTAAVTGWLLARGATHNGLAATIVGILTAKAITVALTFLLGWRQRPHALAQQPERPAHAEFAHLIGQSSVDRPRFPL